MLMREVAILASRLIDGEEGYRRGVLIFIGYAGLERVLH